MFFITFQKNTKFRVHSHTHIQLGVVILSYLKQVGFIKVAQISSLKIDSKLIVALLERWRPEIHIIHLPTNECNIILDDVSTTLGL